VQAWKWQKDMVDQVAATAASSRSSNSSSSGSSSGDGSSAAAGTAAGPPPLGALLLLQHPPVYTLGTGATEGHLKFDVEASPLPLYRTERGGEVRLVDLSCAVAFWALSPIRWAPTACRVQMACFGNCAFAVTC